jgi:hypothetical protein
MGRFVNPDNSAFQAALNSRIYVDKTGLIACMNEVLDSTDAYICNSRPRRFGKTLNFSMLKYFFDINEKDNAYLFDGLKISEYYEKNYIDHYWFGFGAGLAGAGH